MEELILRLAELPQELRRHDISVNSNNAIFEEELISSPDEMSENFRLLTGYDCPESLKVGLLLPDIFSINWVLSEQVSGELSLTNHFMTLNRTLDESLQNWEINEISLSTARIADLVVVHGGPIYILILPLSEGISEKLYLFDTRELFEIELDYQNYLNMLVLTKGVTYWQYMFCHGRKLSGFEKSILEQEISFLETSFPDDDYRELREKLEERGS